eukprot:1157469-Pelagomonas_calceolata.AAC.8
MTAMPIEWRRATSAGAAALWPTKRPWQAAGEQSMRRQEKLMLTEEADKCTALWVDIMSSVSNIEAMAICRGAQHGIAGIALAQCVCVPPACEYASHGCSNC